MGQAGPGLARTGGFIFQKYQKTAGLTITVAAVVVERIGAAGWFPSPAAGRWLEPFPNPGPTDRRNERKHTSRRVTVFALSASFGCFFGSGAV
jgi:hypothetical protein